MTDIGQRSETFLGGLTDDIIACFVAVSVVVAISVEALVFIVIGSICSEGCEFDFHYRPGSFLRLYSRPIMYGAVGSLVFSWSWTRQPGFICFWCLWIQLCNNIGQRLCAYNLP